jgi:hypothetical protein
MEKNRINLASLDASHLAEASDVTQLALHNKKPWYKKPNLRTLYLTLVPAALGVEMTSGYDGSVLNGLQAVTHWVTCTQCNPSSLRVRTNLHADFNNPEGAILGILNAIFGFGCVFAVPFVAWFNDRYGRKAAIILGTCFCIVGVALQTAAINSTDTFTRNAQMLTLIATSWYVSSCAIHCRDGDVSSSSTTTLCRTIPDYEKTLCNRWCICSHCRVGLSFGKGCYWWSLQ